MDDEAAAVRTATIGWHTRMGTQAPIMPKEPSTITFVMVLLTPTPSRSPPSSQRSARSSQAEWTIARSLFGARWCRVGVEAPRAAQQIPGTELMTRRGHGRGAGRRDTQCTSPWGTIAPRQIHGRGGNSGRQVSPYAGDEESDESPHLPTGSAQRSPVAYQSATSTALTSCPAVPLRSIAPTPHRTSP